MRFSSKMYPRKNREKLFPLNVDYLANEQTLLVNTKMYHLRNCRAHISQNISAQP